MSASRHARQADRPTPVPVNSAWCWPCIRLDFDPSATIFGLSIRLETLALAGVVLLVLLLTAIGAGRAGGPAPPRQTMPPRAALPRLRRDDLILIAFGAVPGAVLGGRLGLRPYPPRLLPGRRPARSSTRPRADYGLTLAVVLGTLTAAAVARLLAAPVGRWLGVAAIPVVIGLGLGKLAMALGGAGQGAYSIAFWATSFEHTVPPLRGTTTPLPDLGGVPTPASRRCRPNSWKAALCWLRWSSCSSLPRCCGFAFADGDG